MATSFDPCFRNIKRCIPYLKLRSIVSLYLIFTVVIFVTLLLTFYPTFIKKSIPDHNDLDTITYYQDESDTEFFPKRSETIYIFVAADEMTEEKHRLQIETIRCYAARHHYEFLLGNLDQSEGCKNHTSFLFKRHCALSLIMENLLDDAIVLLFDSDVIVAFQDVPLDHWLLRNEDAAFYERGFSGEVTSGSYQIKNNWNGRHFLKTWSDLEFSRPTGFDSSDNGAVHIALLKYFNLGSECVKEYNALHDSLPNWKPYFHVIFCARQALGMGGFEDGENFGMPVFEDDNKIFRKNGVILSSDGFSVKIYPRYQAWMHDMNPYNTNTPLEMRKKAANQESKTISSTPVFYHNVKKDRQHVVFDYWEKENVTRVGKDGELRYSIFPMCINRQGKILTNSD